MSLPDVGVLLVGHGSHLSAESARPIHTLARALRSKGDLSEVRVAFWKEEPQLHHALDLVESRVVFVVPVFTSEGYFTNRIVPREMGLQGPMTERDGRRIHLCAPVGSHRRMSRVVLERAREAAPLTQEEARAGTLLVVGHGTDRHPASAETTLAIVDQIREEAAYGDVVAAFLDQEPRVGGVVHRLQSPHVVVVPFFISEGWHVGTTLPRDLALTGGRTQRGGTTVWYGLPVGTHPAMADVVTELVQDAWKATGSGREPTDVAGSSDVFFGDGGIGDGGDVPAVRAKRAFLEWIRAGAPGPKVFMQTQVRWIGGNGYEIRHHADAELPLDALRVMRDPEEALELVGTTAEGRHRPLRTAPNLPGGWCFIELDEDAVWDVFTHLYPTAPVHWHQAARGELRVTSFSEVAGRQTGIYEGVRTRTDAEVADLVHRNCNPEKCLRDPMWGIRPGDPALPNGMEETPDSRFGESAADLRHENASRARVPCGEPCTVFISKARKDS